MGIPIQKNYYLCHRNQKYRPMAKIKKTNLTEQNETLKKHIKELEDRLHYSELQNIALNTMIDIAEEKGIQIRKSVSQR